MESVFKWKIKRNWKLAFISTWIIGMLVHMYKFTNTLWTGDSLYNFYSDQNMIGSGRWFLSIACGISSYYDLPWLIGAMSITYIACTAVILTELFQIRSKEMIVLTGGLLAAFPGITQTFFYEFTADGYMLAMFMAALAVYISRMGKHGFLRHAASALLLCMVCGIYQSYVCFALVLIVCGIVLFLLEDSMGRKEKPDEKIEDKRHNIYIYI